MIDITLDPIIARWGPIVLGWHGIWFALGALTLYWVLMHRARARHIDRERLSSVVLWALVAGFLGARLSYVLLYWEQYAAHPLRILAIYEGGNKVYGALAGGAIATAIAARYLRLSLWEVGDAMAVAIPAGELVGRVGCLISGDIWGLPTSGAWGVAYWHPSAALPGYLHGVPTVPIPAMIQILDAGLLGALFVLQSRVTKPGFLFPIYLVGYSLGRLVIGAWQLEAVTPLGLKGTQVMSLAILCCAIALGLYRWRHQDLAGQVAAGKS